MAMGRRQEQRQGTLFVATAEPSTAGHPFDAKRAVYGNRRRVRSDRGKQPQRERGQKRERSNAPLCEIGGMRRTHPRGHDNILKRLIVHAAGFNLRPLIRAMIGIGKPRATRASGKPRPWSAPSDPAAMRLVT